MKKNIKFKGTGVFSVLLCTLFLAGMTSCKNGDKEFDDYIFQTVYFAQQTPIRTIVLGNDAAFDNTLDNEHRFQVYATVGGVWTNRQDRIIHVAVDETLCAGKQFSDGKAVLPLPTTHYQFIGDGTTITIPSGEVQGCLNVQLTDAFFADPKAIDVNYVLPLQIMGSKDSILEKKDYVLYAVKYKNKYDGAWISHGTDEIDLNGVKSTVRREATHLEDNEIRYITTAGLNVANYPVSTTVEANGTIETLTCNLVLTFNQEGQCTVTTTSSGCTATGNGTWTSLGAQKAWGNKDRDELVLNYTITYNYTDGGQARYKTLKSSDTLVMRDRQEKLETFSLK